jgi:hypothetical protein
MRLRNIVVALSVVFLALAAQARAATITYVGAVQGDEVTGWRHAAVAKTQDIDGNGVYGSVSAIDIGGAAVGLQGVYSTTRGLAGVASNAEGTATGQTTYVSIDAVTGAGTINPGIQYNSTGPMVFSFQLTGVDADYAGKTVRFGVMQNLLGSGTTETGRSIRLNQSVGGAGDSGTIVESIAAAGTPQMYLFDITGVAPGIAGVRTADQFTLTVSSTGTTPYFGALTVDIVPEPSTIILLVMGVIGLLAYAWRKQK